jgi:thiol-disulfide isomerase/thioredoxin
MINRPFFLGLLGVLLLFLVSGCQRFLFNQSPPTENQKLMEDQSNLVPTGNDQTANPDININTSLNNSQSVKLVEPSTSSSDFVGAKLAGQQALLLDFVFADYQKALAANKIIVLYFYANWCPICVKEFPQMQAAFDQLTTDKIIGFRLNYNDDQVEAAEEQLARQFGVAYQHTKVILVNGQRVLKSPQSWDQQRYLAEINKLLNQ